MNDAATSALATKVGGFMRTRDTQKKQMQQSIMFRGLGLFVLGFSFLFAMMVANTPSWVICFIQVPFIGGVVLMTMVDFVSTNHDGFYFMTTCAFYLLGLERILQ